MRKRAILCLGHLVMSCDQTLYIKLINMLLEELAKSGNTSSTRTYIQALGAVCRQAGHRFGDHVERVMPLIMQYARGEDDELKEHVLQVLSRSLDTFMFNNFRLVRQWCPSVAVKFLPTFQPL